MATNVERDTEIAGLKARVKDLEQIVYARGEGKPVETGTELKKTKAELKAERDAAAKN